LGSAAVHLTMTIRQPEVNGQRVETRRNLSGREYEALRAQADATRLPIKKVRRSFLYQDRYFQIDVFQSPHPGLVILETYLDYDQHTVDGSAVPSLLPDWLDLQEITDDKSFSMFELASKTCPQMKTP
jgi:CYTH domain-containing protein